MAERKNALARAPEIVFRASMLPVGNYEDGSIAFPVWPQTAVDAYEALGRFGRGENPQPQDAVLAGLAMAGSGIGHLGLRAAGRAVSGAAPESVAASRTLPSVTREGGNFIARSPHGEVRAWANDADKTAQVTHSLVAPAQRGQGHGTGLYSSLIDELISKGYRLQSDTQVSPEAGGVYNALRRRGYNIAENPRVMRDKRGYINSDDGLPVFTVEPPVALPSHSVEAGSPIIDPQIAAGDAAAAAVPDTRSWWQKTTGSGEAELGIARLEARKAAMRADAIEGLRDVPPSGPIRAKVYRGASRDEQWPPSSYEGRAFWASDNRDAASAYAGTPGDNAVTNWLIDTQGFDQARIPKGHITPAEIAFQKPLVLDAKGGQWGNIKVGNRNYYTDQLADLAREFGHDGLVVRNVVDDAPAGTTYAALQPGTVRSATTGETLFSNPKEAAPAGLLATDQKNDSMPQQSDFDRAFSELDAALIDLDGDGVPDVQVPRNALAGAQVPQRLVPRGAQPIQPGFEMLPSDVPQRPMNALTGGGAQPQMNALSPPMNAAERGADEMMPRYRGPVDAPPQQGFVGRNLNALANYTNGIVRDVTDDPVGAAEGALNFFGGYGAGSGAVRDVMLQPADKTVRGLLQRELRSYTESGARKNGLEQVEIGARRAQEARDAFNAHPDVVMSRQPHQQLQGRDPKTGRWQKFTDEVREARDRGIELRRRDQAGTDLAKKWSEGSN